MTRGYVYLGGQLLAVQEGRESGAGRVLWVHQDPVTKSQRLTDRYGKVVSTVELDPWGGETSRSENQGVQPRRYTTYERDSNGGDEAMFRRYESKWARFAQPDPYDGSYNLSDPQSFNRYAYTQNDPVNFVDPSGLMMQCYLSGIEHVPDTNGLTYYIWTCTSGAGDNFTGIGDRPGGGGGGNSGPQSPEPQDPCPPKIRKFLETGLPYFRYMAAKLETDPAFFAALSAKESAWGRSYAFRVKNNLFGVSIRERPVRYRSRQGAADSWLRMFGQDVSGAPTMDDFAGALKSVGRWERPYNSADPGYYDSLMKYHEDVEAWAKTCGIQF